MQGEVAQAQSPSVALYVWVVVSQVQVQVLDWALELELCVFVMQAVAEWTKQQRRGLLQRRQMTLKSWLLVWRTHE